MSTRTAPDPLLYPLHPLPKGGWPKALFLFPSMQETFLSSTPIPQKLRQLWGNHSCPFPGPHHGKGIKCSAFSVFLPKMGVFQL